MKSDITITTVKVRIKRMRTDDGQPLWRASLESNPLCRRHASTREEAVLLLSQAYLQPEIRVTIGKKEESVG